MEQNVGIIELLFSELWVLEEERLSEFSIVL